jgi:[acyl-carrier-protein] S-malonyltransferase
MGRDLAEAFPEAAEVFAEANEVLGFDLRRLCWEGPAEELQLTANQQPALVAVSTAAARVLAAQGLAPAAVAGHSLGEYSALVAAGAVELADALRLVRRRGELMQEAVPVGVGAMAAILSLDVPTIRSLVAEAAQGQVCSVANLNSPQQTVIAGHAEAVGRAIELAKAAGARRAMLLPVSAPFHCELMAPAREGLEPMLRATTFREAKVPVVVNVEAAPVTDGDGLREALVRQIEGSVRWVESAERLAADGATRFLEVGPGNVLAGLIKRIVEGVPVVAAGTAPDIAALTP